MNYNDEKNFGKDEIKTSNKQRHYSNIKLTMLKDKRIISLFLKIFIIIYIIKPRETSSSIHIVINQKGNHAIYSEASCAQNSFIIPDEIEINGVKQEDVMNNYELVSNENKINLIWNREINSTACLFRRCRNITEIDLSDFHSTELMFIYGMFWHCQSLTSINFRNFNTSKVKDMQHLFNDCQNLKELDLSKLDTSLVTHMINMFADCHSLVSLNLSNFKTSKVTKIYYMFSNCYSLTELDLTNFDTSFLKKMNRMFENCISLSKLNLSGLNTSKVDNMDYMFSNCSTLIS